MFILKLYDRDGKELSPGDIVEISDGRRFTFYAEVKWLEKEQVITPFHTFSFHSFRKVDKVPENAFKCNEERYNIWAVDHNNETTDESAKDFDQYLMDWRHCESLLEKIMWRIELKK